MEKILNTISSFLSHFFKNKRAQTKVAKTSRLLTFNSVEKLELQINRFNSPPGNPEKVEVNIERTPTSIEITLFDAPLQIIGTMVHAEALANLIRESFFPEHDPEKIVWKILYRGWERNYDHLMKVNFRYNRECQVYEWAEFVALTENESWQYPANVVSIADYRLKPDSGIALDPSS